MKGIVTTLKGVGAPELSLVMGTVGRTRELQVFLDALGGQFSDRVELVIVDQNPDRRVPSLLAERREAIPIRLIRVPWRGLSRARNVGVRQARGAILGFPDDDCWYPPGLIDQVLEWFAEHREADGLTCRVTDERGRHSAGGLMSATSHWVSRANIWRSAVSPGLFVRRRLYDAVGGFDERLGRGAATPWGSGEETDCLLRAMNAGRRIFYDADLVVGHPQTIGRRPRVTRAWSYGRGMGFVLCKNDYGLAAAAYFASLSWGSAALSCLRLAPGPALARAVMGAGRLVGWYQANRGPARLPDRFAQPDDALRARMP